MAPVKEWSRFGWQGITFDVPVDWDVTRFHGTRRKGYARLSDPGAARMELRWDRPKRRTVFEALADRVTKQIAKAGRLAIERHTGLAQLNGKDCETFTCRPSRGQGPSSYHMISLCRECGRLVMARIVFAPGESLGATAKRVFGSMQDHSYDGADVWAAYQAQFAVPETMELDIALIYPGSLDFRFVHRKDRIDVGRLGPGSLILRNTTLRDWFRSFARKRFKKIKYESRETEIKGHPGLELTGRLRGLGALAPRLVRRQRYLCRLWHCDVSDKLYFFAVLARRRDFDRFAAYYERVVCHQ